MSIRLSGDKSLIDVRQHVERKITQKLRQEWWGVISALMAMGKTYAAVEAARKTGIPVTILTGRGHQEQYSEILKHARSENLVAKRIPSLHEDCPTAQGEHGTQLKREMKSAASRGVAAGVLHEVLNPPCEPHCPYRDGMSAIIEQDYDLLVGHYKHAYLPPVINDRAVFIDEFFENSYETEVTPRRISNFLNSKGAPVKSFTELCEADEDIIREFFESEGLHLSDRELFNDDGLTSLAGVAAWGVITSRPLGNGWQAAVVWDYNLGVNFDESSFYHVALNGEEGDVYVFNPPGLHGARNVIGLDGTATMPMWQLVLEPHDNYEQIFRDEERSDYIEHILDHEYILTTRYPKPYSPRPKEIMNRVNLSHDTTLLEAIHFREGTAPDLITTKRAKEYFEEQRTLELANVAAHYPVLGSNEFKESRVGVVIGYPRLSDDYINKWAAYQCTLGIQRDENNRSSVSEIGNAILRQMREHTTLQTVMRFGRDGQGATVYVDTNTLPDWVPIQDEMIVAPLEADSDLGEVVDAAEGRENFTAGEIAEEIEPATRTCQQWLSRLYEGGYIKRRRVGRSYRYSDDGLKDIDYGILYSR